jgi:hypothetical protein
LKVHGKNGPDWNHDENRVRISQAKARDLGRWGGMQFGRRKQKAGSSAQNRASE